ncbi:unnamed protein product [Orchesella dallaii]|uniref:Metalloendopeptidase n=1 Tax=Orchesella dallaii TaxID=48710 RepID=A0ABP1RYI5_9HEXA
MPEEEKLVILNAMKSISSQTCVIFTPLTNEVDFLSIKALRGHSPCRSVFGRTTGEQVMQLGVTPYKNCIEHGTILHYLMKVLGFPSEHRRPDRDEYVVIYWANIISGKRFTFQKLEKEIFIYDLDKEPYDYFSLMHPDPYKFARDPEIPVIFPKNVDETEIEIGQRVGLSDGDIRKIRDAYNCPSDRIRLSNSGEMIRRLSNSNWFWKVLHLIWIVGSKVFPDRGDEPSNPQSTPGLLKFSTMIQKLIVVALVLGSLYSQSDAQLVNYDQFSNALTWLGYPAPSWDQYNVFVNSAGPKGQIWDKQEAAMALTHYIHESDGLRAKREYRCEGNGCPGDYETPGCDVGGQDYYGRGYIQLTWCYNYRAASYDLFGDERLVQDPDSVARSEELAWDTAFYFWKVNVHSQPGVAEGRFGVTTNAINGNLECRGEYVDVARRRFEMYKSVRNAFGLDPNAADERGCYN